MHENHEIEIKDLLKCKHCDDAPVCYVSHCFEFSSSKSYVKYIVCCKNVNAFNFECSCAKNYFSVVFSLDQIDDFNVDSKELERLAISELSKSWNNAQQRVDEDANTS